MLFERGLNVKQVQRWLGHHSPSFTLDTYVHLLDERLPDALRLSLELAPTPAILREDYAPVAWSGGNGESRHSSAVS